jgi:hypothetical protein
MAHEHEWVLIDTYDNYTLPKHGMYDIAARIVDIINSPHRTSQTWACSCGKTKYNHQETETTTSLLAKRNHKNI